jgi:hypothetical protein
MDCVRNIRPWKVITTSNPQQTLGDAEISDHPTLIEACNAFVRDPAPFKQIVFDDGERARELAPREEQFLANVCNMLGWDVEPLDAA